MSMFLNSDEVAQLTGCKMPGYQCRWLSKNGYRFERASNGRPVVLRSHVESRLSGMDQPKERRLNMAGVRG